MVRNYLELHDEGSRPREVNGSIAAHVAELHRRVRRMRRMDAGIEVRVSPEIEALSDTSVTHQEIWG